MEQKIPLSLGCSSPLTTHNFNCVDFKTLILNFIFFYDENNFNLLNCFGILPKKNKKIQKVHSLLSCVFFFFF